MAKQVIADKARYTAAVVLCRVIEEGAFSNIALNTVIEDQHLSRQDAAFMAYLVLGVLERKLYLDWVIGKRIKRWPGHPLVRQALRLGCYQVLFSDSVPDSAAANSAVELCKSAGAGGLSGLVNGVLRAVIREKDGIRAPGGPSAEETALRLSCQPWMVEMLSARYSADEIDDMLGFHAVPLTVYVNPGADIAAGEAVSRLIQDGWDVKPGKWAPEALRLYGSGNIAGHPLYRNGTISIISESAMLAVLALDAQPGERVLDACAAPGGKTCLLASSVGDAGTVDAWDIHPHRVELIRAQAKRLRIGNINAGVQDASLCMEDRIESYDRVLCDMPCTGWGVLGQKPELRFNADINDIGGLCAVQQDILECCSRYVRPGGVLAYVTCTVNKMENQDIVESFLEHHKEYAPDDLAGYLPQGLRPYIRQKGMIQLITGRDEVPGFFICRMVRGI